MAETSVPDITAVKLEEDETVWEILKKQSKPKTSYQTEFYIDNSTSKDIFWKEQKLWAGTRGLHNGGQVPAGYYAIVGHRGTLPAGVKFGLVFHDSQGKFQIWSYNLFAELLGTFFVIFSGCGSVAVNKIYGSVTFPGICVTWGLIVMVMVYTLGHVSGAHFNPAVTVTFALLGRFPWKEVPLYICGQLGGSLLASCTLTLMMTINSESFFGTVPVGSNVQSLAAEIIISFLLMFVISGVATDSRAIGEMAGLAVGMTIMLNVLVAGPISGASMNPARSLGPAIVTNTYKGIWVYMVGPTIGIVAGGFAYNLIRFTDKPIREITQSNSILRSLSKAAGSSSEKV